MANEELQRSPFQDRVLAIPEDFDVFLGGGRGGAKSYTLALLALRHLAQYGARARILYLRQTYKGLADFELVCRELFGNVYGPDARYNAAEHVWRFPEGGYLELGQLEGIGAYSKYQGRSFTLLLIDEAGQFPRPDTIDLLRSNLRGPRDVPIRMIVAANPGGPGHYWIARRYVFTAKPWAPFLEAKSNREWIYAPSTYRDNPFIDTEQYLAQLQSSCPTDPELLRAWTDGDWAVARGAYFADCLEEARVAVGPFKEIPYLGREKWPTYLAHDFGSTRPSATYLLAESPGATWDGRFYPRGSIVVIDEYATYRDLDNLNVGLGWTAAVTGEALLEWCKGWKVPARGIADDQCFATTGVSGGTIAAEFARVGVTFRPAQKGDRISGWQKMRRMLADAGKTDVPGLYVSRSCAYFWATVPFLVRDPKRIEDLDSNGPDHGADALRYGLKHVRWAMDTTIRVGRP